MSNRFKLSI